MYEHGGEDALDAPFGDELLLPVFPVCHSV
jgi:hypothetical protein